MIRGLFVSLPRAGNAVSQLFSNLLRGIKPSSMVVWMLLRAVLFLAGAAHASMAGAMTVAKVGVLGAIAAIAFIAAFSG
jgi:hypothetical protein